MFIDMCGISKSQSSVDYAMLEYCIREDLKMKRSRMMAVLDPIKLVIDNYPEGEVEYLDVANNLENEELGQRKFRSVVNSTSRETTSWKNRQRNISVCSRGMKFV